jgi:hypothetical protein
VLVSSSTRIFRPRWTISRAMLRFREVQSVAHADGRSPEYAKDFRKMQQETA